jgi:hypothetical protein
MQSRTMQDTEISNQSHAQVFIWFHPKFFGKWQYLRLLKMKMNGWWKVEDS